MEVIYNGTNISEYINTTRAEYDSFLGHHADKIMIAIDSTDDATQGWGFRAGDEIRIKENSIDSGKMTVYKVEEDEEETVIYAAAILKSYELNTNEWSKIGFKELAEALAKNLDCKAEFYGLDDDFIYDKVKQKNADDLEFLNFRCWLEGCVVIVLNGVMKVISEDWLETQKVSSDQLDTLVDSVKSANKKYLKECTVYDKDREKSGSYSRAKGNGAISMTFDFPFTSIEEGRRFAKNVLRSENRKKKTGVAYADEVIESVMTGNLLKITTGEWKEKPVVITHMRYNFEDENTKIWFRLIGGD